MPYIQSIGIAEAPFKHAQKDILSFMLDMYPEHFDQQDKVARLYDRSEIETRYSAIEDFSLQKSERKFFVADQEPTIEQRMKKYFEVAPVLAKQAILACIPSRNQLEQITHLITVSCTGISAPGLDIMLLRELNLSPNIHRTSVNFMGCYATMHALKMADAFCKADKDAKVLIVSIELCTLHFQNSCAMDQIAASLLFGDGAAAALVSNEEGPYMIDQFYAEVNLQAFEDMSWNITSNGFLMSLSSYIPSIIAEKIEPMLVKALSQTHLTPHEIAHWAIHPGGKKIIQEVAKALSLTEEQTNVSRRILKDYGNMSSATILFVLYEMQQEIENKNESVFCAAFGPGLTIESMILQTSKPS
ncbi:MAG: type III polyketide synthase [Chitinophagaceae bacterium]|nr:type III polyketide synthase [Chitinophagaceae bacterium]